MVLLTNTLNPLIVNWLTLFTAMRYIGENTCKIFHLVQRLRKAPCQGCKMVVFHSLVYILV